MLQKTLFRIAKSPWMGKIVGMAFQYGSWAIPVERIIANKDVFVFRHPRPCYQNHIILSPKRSIQNLQQMAAPDLNGYFAKIWAAAIEVCAKQPEVYDSFKLVANGGKCQEVQQVHFHLFTNHPAVKDCSNNVQDGNIFYQNEEICVYEHPRPEWEVHFVLKPAQASQCAYFRNVLHSINLLNNQFHIVQKGYSLVYQHNPQKNDREIPVFHITSGKKRA